MASLSLKPRLAVESKLALGASAMRYLIVYKIRNKLTPFSPRVLGTLLALQFLRSYFVLEYRNQPVEILCWNLLQYQFLAGV